MRRGYRPVNQARFFRHSFFLACFVLDTNETENQETLPLRRRITGAVHEGKIREQAA